MIRTDVPLVPDLVAARRRFWRQAELIPVALAANELGISLITIHRHQSAGMPIVPIVWRGRERYVRRGDLDRARQDYQPGTRYARGAS